MKQVEFKGSGSEYFKIWIVNVLLCMITFGIYYPWAKVRNLRYFYANTEYAERYFDYHATGKQLFIGYLIGVGVLIVFNILVNFVPTIGALLFVALFIAIPWIIWRSLQFNMRMTSFSNVRFGFVGELKSSYFIFMLLPVLGYLAVIITVAATLFASGLSSDSSGTSAGAIILIVLGSLAAIALSIFLMGFFTKKVAEYQIGNTKFGQGDFKIDVNTNTFVKIALKTALIYTAIVLAFTAIIGLSSYSVLAGGISTESLATGMDSSLMFAFIALYIGFIAAALFAAAYSYSRQRAYMYANTKLDDSITFKSTVTAKDFFLVLISNMFIIVLSLGLAMPWAKVRVARYIAENTWIEAKDVDINHYLTQKETEQSAIAEELGDVLDIGVDIAI